MAAVVEPEWVDEGDGAKALRMIPFKGRHLDPFVIFDEYFVEPSASFPMHPHGGFEGFQFLMEGATKYEDDQGNLGRIGKGEIRRFVPGPGFQHSEYPEPEEIVRGYLLWMKLPNDYEPERSIFQELHEKEVMVIEDDLTRTTLIFGEGAPLETITPAVFKHIIFKTDHFLELELASGWSGFVYVSKGLARVCGELVKERTGIILDQGCTCHIDGSEGTEMVFVRGKMLGERIIQDGHYVR